MAHVFGDGAADVGEAEAFFGGDEGGAGGGERRLVPEPAGAVGGVVGVEARGAVMCEGGVVRAAIDDEACPDEGVVLRGEGDGAGFVAGDGGRDVLALRGEGGVLEDVVEVLEALGNGVLPDRGDS